MVKKGARTGKNQGGVKIPKNKDIESAKSVKTKLTETLRATKQKIKPAKKTARGQKTKIEQALIDNFVSMQKVLTNLSVKFDNLAEQISKLLQLFEISAKSFVEKQNELGSEDREFTGKLNALLDQNKTIARGLTLLEQRMKGRYDSGGMANTLAPMQAQTQTLAPRPQAWAPQPKAMFAANSRSPIERGYEQSRRLEKTEYEDKEKIKPKPLPKI